MEKTQNKFRTFLRKNLSYLIVAFCVLAIGLATILIALNNESSGDLIVDNPIDTPVEKPDDTPIDTPVEKPDQTPTDTPVDKPDDTPIDTPVDKPIENPEPEQISFIMPVASFNDISSYSETLVFNQTLGRYASHKATDFYAAEGTSVLAVYDGVVETVENSLLKGYTVTIDHGNGLKTVYNSLSDSIPVNMGQTVKKGDVIGAVSTTNRQEYKEGAHLHFEVLQDGESIDPASYLIFDEK